MEERAGERRERREGEEASGGGMAEGGEEGGRASAYIGMILGWWGGVRESLVVLRVGEGGIARRGLEAYFDGSEGVEVTLDWYRVLNSSSEGCRRINVISLTI